MMTYDVENWIKSGEGQTFLREIGLKEGDRVLDIGAGEGHYTIPAAQLVGSGGQVYALDQDRGTLKRLMEEAKKQKLNNIFPIQDQAEKLSFDWEPNAFDGVLIYDIIHFLEPEERADLYNRVFEMLKAGGLLSVYPKHNRFDFAMLNLAHLNLDDVAKEIEQQGFYPEARLYKRLIHDENYDQGYVLNYRKK